MITRASLQEVWLLIEKYFPSSDGKTQAHESLSTFYAELSQMAPVDSEVLADRLKLLIPAHLAKLGSIAAPEISRVQFMSMFLKYLLGDRGIINIDELGELRPSDMVSYDRLTDEDRIVGESAIKSVGFLKLNGGLGTTMGCTGPKSSIPVHDNRSFLDFILDQIIALQSRYECQIPLVLLNSYHTEDATKSIINQRVSYISLKQHQVPRIDVRSGEPVCFPNDPNSEWNPPGHGDLYAALLSSGALDRLLAEGIQYLFISNSDNLGANVDLKILGYMVRHDIDFLMETTRKTLADRKGGTLVKHQDRLFLLERAQVASDQSSEFENIARFKIFNTNNVWINLQKVREKINTMAFSLPLIVNPKTVNGLRVDQLESALGAAISLFGRSATVVVPRNRFMPVKSAADLFLMRSDVIIKTPSGDVGISPQRELIDLPEIHLDVAYQTVQGFDDLVLIVPSLLRCKSIKVSGRVHFGEGVSIAGEVRIESTHPDGLFLENIHLQNEGLYHSIDGQILRTTF